MVTQFEIARRVGLNVSSVNKILNRRRGPVFREKTVKKVFRVAHQLGYSLERLKHDHHRRHPRTPVLIEASVQVYGQDGILYDQGRGMIRDISASGAQLSDLSLSRNALPAGRFSIAVRPLQGGVDCEVRGELVRLKTQRGSATFGFRLSDLDPTTESKWRALESESVI